MIPSHTQCHVTKHSCPYNMSSYRSENISNMSDARCKSHTTKRSPALWKNKEITPAMGCQQFQWQELTTTWSAGILSVFGKDGSIFSVCSSTGEFLIDFQKIIITANLCLAPLTDCIACCDAAYDAELADRRPGAYRSTKISFLYLFTRKTQTALTLSWGDSFHLTRST